jgi:tRNA U34 5-carboxymethylaminomethyl modifying GTPase MnmE/TrmE
VTGSHPSTALDASVLGDGRTIAAIATAPGRSALAIVRLSGPDVSRIAERLLRPPPPTARQAMRTHVVDPNDGSVLDDVIATRFIAPASFTGEDLLEITTHGGYRAPTSVLVAAIQAGARQAEPGEFTRRAVLNGKLDLFRPKPSAISWMHGREQPSVSHCTNSTAAVRTRPRTPRAYPPGRGATRL